MEATELHSRVLAERLVASLPSNVAGLFNPWRDRCDEDRDVNGPEAKLGRLAAHLDCRPRFLLCGEAAGWQGKRHSGLAFTSERLLLAGSIPRVPRIDQRLTTRALPFSEPSATIVWKTLYRLGIAEDTVLWNALPMHPHRAQDARSNRTPKGEELALGRAAMRLMIDAFPYARVIAVGKKAEGLLRELQVPIEAAVRHPANGGATAFAEGMRSMVMRAPARSA